jgi:spermidine/putrescine transport system permease protein
MTGEDRSGESRGGFARWAAVPALVATLALFVAPLLVMATTSLWLRVGGDLVHAWSFANYAAFLGNRSLVEALVNSLEVTALVTLLSVVLAYPLALVLAYRVPKRLQRLALVLAVLPFWTSYVIRSYSWLLVLSEAGVINQALLGLGLVDAPIAMGNTRGATILGFVHFFVMLLTLTTYASLVQIKDSYRLAAADLGASPVQVFLRITLPLSLPGVAVGAFLTFVLAIGDYVTPQILGGGKELLLPQAIMLQVARRADFPLASAMSMVLMLVVTVAYLAFAKRLKMERV